MDNFQICTQFVQGPVTGLTALDALELGYRTWVVEDGTRGCFEDQIEDMKNRIRKKGGIFVQSHEV